jgi:hypothetical protein
VNDPELLEQLRHALVPEPVEPSQASIVALRRAIPATSVAAPRRWRVGLAVPVITGIVLATGSGVAVAASGAVLPRPVRQVAHTLGLPVDSPALADARGARHRLAADLASGNHLQVKRAAAELRARLSELSGDERGDIEHSADTLLQQADTLDEQQHGLTPGGPGDGSRQGDDSSHQGGPRSTGPPEPGGSYGPGDTPSIGGTTPTSASTNHEGP